MKDCLYKIFVLVILTLPSVCFGASKDEVFGEFAKRISTFKLSNALTVVFYERKQAPIFTGQIWVKAGGVNEQIGQTGIAHFLEHMAFKGTQKIGTKNYALEKDLLTQLDKEINNSSPDKARIDELYKSLSELWVENEYGTLYQARGAVGLNAGTSKDSTYYTVSLPNTEFEFWCWMESDRLLNPVFRQFYKERDVIAEERRMRTDNEPGGKLYESLLASAFQSHPYRMPTIGWPSDIRRLAVEDMNHFYHTYYRPDNMVISIVGDLDPEVLKPVLEKYFGRLKIPSTAIPEVTTVEEAQEGERRIQIEVAAEPQIIMAYHKPVYPNKDDLQFAILHSILGEGRSSILNRELVQDKKLFSAIYTTEAPGERFPSLFIVGGLLNKGVTNQQAIDAVQEILDRIKTKMISEELVQAAQRKVLMGLLSSLDDNENLAELLGKSVLFYGSWERIIEMYAVINATTPSDLMRITKDYLTVTNRTVAEIGKPRR